MDIVYIAYYTMRFAIGIALPDSPIYKLFHSTATALNNFRRSVYRIYWILSSRYQTRHLI